MQLQKRKKKWPRSGRHSSRSNMPRLLRRHDRAVGSPFTSALVFSASKSLLFVDSVGGPNVLVTLLDQSLILLLVPPFHVSTGLCRGTCGVSQILQQVTAPPPQPLSPPPSCSARLVLQIPSLSIANPSSPLYAPCSSF